jgi:glyoxylate utilization-related uncharacterized protein
VKTRNLTDLVRFSEDDVRREVLFDSDHLFSQVVCLQGNQVMGPLSDTTSEAIVAVLTGEVAAQVDKGRARMKQWETALVPAGSELTLRNASSEPTVVLLIIAPPPVAGDASSSVATEHDERQNERSQERRSAAADGRSPDEREGQVQRLEDAPDAAGPRRRPDR